MIATNNTLSRREFIKKTSTLVGRFVALSLSLSACNIFSSPAPVMSDPATEGITDEATQQLTTSIYNAIKSQQPINVSYRSLTLSIEENAVLNVQSQLTAEYIPNYLNNAQIQEVATQTQEHAQQLNSSLSPPILVTIATIETATQLATQQTLTELTQYIKT